LAVSAGLKAESTVSDVFEAMAVTNRVWPKAVMAEPMPNVVKKLLPVPVTVVPEPVSVPDPTAELVYV